MSMSRFERCGRLVAVAAVIAAALFASSTGLAQCRWSPPPVYVPAEYDGYPRMFHQLAIIGREGSGPPRHDGWYCDPNFEEVPEVGVGNDNFLVVAVDNEDERMMFVGPVYSYYEFRTAASNRLTDGRWQEQLKAGTMPNRPQWTSVFAGPRKKRELK